MVWPLSSCLYLTPPPVIHEITRLPTFVLTIKCIFAGLMGNSLHVGLSMIITSGSGTHRLVKPFAVDGIALSPTQIESSPADRLIAPWHRYGDTICLFDVYRLSEMWVKDTQTWRLHEMEKGWRIIPISCKGCEMDNGSGQWATVSGRSRAQEESSRATAWSDIRDTLKEDSERGLL